MKANEDNKNGFSAFADFKMKANEDNFGKGDCMGMKLKDGDVVIDGETGTAYEAHYGDTIDTAEDKKRRKNYVEQSNLDGHRNLEYEKSNSVRGGFTVVLCKNFENIYRSDITAPTLNKLIYLSTFIGSDNTICKDGFWDGYKRDEVPMTLQEIKATINVSEPSWRSFWRECESRELILKDGDTYKLPIDMFRFCNDKKVNKKKTAMIKLFRRAVRYMYENTDEHSKRVLSYLYRLIPFINLKYNVLCMNPFEQDKEKIVPLKASDICEKFGVPVKNQSRFVQQLKKLRFKDKLGRENSVITYRWIVSDNEEIYWVTINPAFYSGYMSVADSLSAMDEFLMDENNFLIEEGKYGENY